MVSSVLLLLLTMWTLANSLVALAVVVALRRALRSTLNTKNLNSVKADFAELQSDYVRLFEMVKKLSQRQSLADHKAKQREADTEDGPPARTKDELRKKWLHNRTHADIARLAMRGSEQ